MKAEVSRKLEESAQKTAEMYSQVRGLNPTAEIFTVRKVKPLTETTAAVVYVKTPQKEGHEHKRKLALAFFFYVPSDGGNWLHMFVSYNHIHSLKRLEEMLEKVEEYNHRENQRKPA